MMHAQHTRNASPRATSVPCSQPVLSHDGIMPTVSSLATSSPNRFDFRLFACLLITLMPTLSCRLLAIILNSLRMLAAVFGVSDGQCSLKISDDLQSICTEAESRATVISTRIHNEAPRWRRGPMGEGTIRPVVKRVEGIHIFHDSRECRTS
jgi:hypothetical protein